MTTAAIEIPDELIEALKVELRDHAKGFISQTKEELEFCEVEGQLKDCHHFGNLWQGKDYAWRVLLNPSFQAEVILGIGNRDDSEVVDGQWNQVGLILDALSEAMPDDATIDLMAEGDGAAEVLTNKLHVYFLHARSSHE